MATDLKLMWTTCETMLKDVNDAIDRLCDLREQVSLIIQQNHPLPSDKKNKEEVKKVRKTKPKKGPHPEASQTPLENSLPQSSSVDNDSS